MLPNFVIGFREGLEAALIVGILVASLVRAGRRDRLVQVWIGVGAAIVLSIAAYAAISAFAGGLSHEQAELFAGVMSLVAVGFVTWMILWMRKTARHLRSQLDGQVSDALKAGPWAVAATAFFAVAREGIETVLFLWSAMRATGTGAGPIAGGALGLAAAVVLGYLIYRGALRINLSAFFTWTSIALVLVAAWVVEYGLHEIAEAGFGGETLEVIAPIAAVAYALVMGWVLWTGRRKKQPEAPQVPTEASDAAAQVVEQEKATTR